MSKDVEDTTTKNGRSALEFIELCALQEDIGWEQVFTNLAQCADARMATAWDTFNDEH